MKNIDLIANKSTHGTLAWCWVCTLGWKYFYPESKVTVELLTWAVNHIKVP